MNRESILNNIEIATELLNSAFDAFHSGKFITVIHLAGGIITVLPDRPKNLPVCFEEFTIREQVFKTGGTVSGEEIEYDVKKENRGPRNRVKHYDCAYKIKKSEVRLMAINDLKLAFGAYINNINCDSTSIESLQKTKEMLSQINYFLKEK